jgi:hypothetical protein
VRRKPTVERREATSPPHRLWQLLLAGCLLLGLLSDVFRVAHWLAVEHVACPYDGAVVHEDELPAEARAHGPRSRDPELGHVSVAPRHDHGACAAHAVADRPFVLASFGDAPAARAEPRSTTPAMTVMARVMRSVLSYAPKLPPPV